MLNVQMSPIYFYIALSHFFAIYCQMIDDIINRSYDSTKDIPGTYSEAWERTISEAWDNVEQSTEAVPGESEKDKPSDGDDEDKDDPEGGGGGSGDSNNDQEETPEGGDDNDNTGNPNISKSALDHATKNICLRNSYYKWGI